MATLSGELSAIDSPESPRIIEPATTAAVAAAAAPAVAAAAAPAVAATGAPATEPVPPSSTSQLKIWEEEDKKKLERKRQAFSEMEQAQREESKRFLEDWCQRREERLQRQQAQAAEAELPSVSTTADGAEPNPPASTTTANWRRVVEILGLGASGPGIERSSGRESSSTMLGLSSSTKIPNSRAQGGTSSRSSTNFSSPVVENSGAAMIAATGNCDVSRMQQFLLDLASK